MIKLEDNSIILKTYEEAKSEIGIYHCYGKEIDNDTTVVFKMFYKDIVKTGSLAKDHEVVTLWLCTANVFCKCGKYHPITSNDPAEQQIMNILMDIHHQTGLKFVIPTKGEEPTRSLIVYNLTTKWVKKEVEDINDWL